MTSIARKWSGLQRHSQRIHPRNHARRLLVETLEDRSLLAAFAGAAAMKFAPAAAARAAAVTDDAYEQNDSRGTASNLGRITAPRTIPNLVMGDSSDWFRYSTAARGGANDNVTINFQHVQGDLDVALYNSYGQRLRLADGVGDSERLSLTNLAAGNYFIRVYGYRGAFNPSYSLSVNVGAPATPTDDIYENNDTLETARDLGTLTSPLTLSTPIMADGHDWYRFSMNATGAGSDFVGINFQNAQGNLDLELYGATGTLLVSSTLTTNGEQISLSGLAAGTYYVHVLGVAGAANPNYSLQIDPSAPPAPPTPAGAFDIQFAFAGLTAAQQSIFDQAAAKWESIIVGDLPNATYNGTTVDDLLIEARAVPIDGTGRILGQAGPDRFRTGSGLPYHGIMEFDSADVASMTNNGTLLSVILHEMGHVLGIGTLWTSTGLLVGRNTTNPIFVGAQATAAYNDIFGTSASGVPVENTGGSGTRNSHFRESIFRHEIMTGWVGPGTNMPISRITVGSLADIGYTVNFAAADPYTPPASSSSGAGSGSSSSIRGSIIQPTSPALLPLHHSERDGIFTTLDPQAGNNGNDENQTSLTTPRSHVTATDALLANWLSHAAEITSMLGRV